MTGFNHCAPDRYCVVLLSQREDNYECSKKLCLIGLTTLRSYMNVFQAAVAETKSLRPGMWGSDDRKWEGNAHEEGVGKAGQG